MSEKGVSGDTKKEKEGARESCEHVKVSWVHKTHAHAHTQSP